MLIDLCSMAFFVLLLYFDIFSYAIGRRRADQPRAFYSHTVLSFFLSISGPPPPCSHDCVKSFNTDDRTLKLKGLVTNPSAPQANAFLLSSSEVLPVKQRTLTRGGRFFAVDFARACASFLRMAAVAWKPSRTGILKSKMMTSKGPSDSNFSMHSCPLEAEVKSASSLLRNAERIRILM